MTGDDPCNPLDCRELWREEVLLRDLDLERLAEELQELDDAHGVDVPLFEEIDSVTEVLVGGADAELAPDEVLDQRGDLLRRHEASPSRDCGVPDR